MPTAGERQTYIANVASSMAGPTVPPGSRVLYESAAVLKPDNPTAMTTHDVVAPTIYDAAWAEGLRVRINEKIDIMKAQGLAS